MALGDPMNSTEASIPIISRIWLRTTICTTNQNSPIKTNLIVHLLCIFQSYYCQDGVCVSTTSSSYHDLIMVRS